MPHLINGKALSQKLNQELFEKVSLLEVKPTLHVVLIGDNPASQIYVRSKQGACALVGIESTIHVLDKNVEKQKVLELISALNEDKNVHGILLQLPLPSSFDTQEILEYLNPLKDVDGLHPQNAGLLMQGRPRFIPCTPHGCLKLIKTVIPDLKGTTVGILGRSVLVGKPMAQLILNENATLIHMHSFTKNVKDLCKLCDVLVVAVGKPHLIDKSYLKSNVVVIDVGINRLENKKITGDVDFESALGSCQAITPVPGGVGPMTIAGLLQNTYLAYQLAIPT